ncbi:GNAT family N-acetyltransferase [Pusillimonas sp.]|uniref:bifunctional acetate--CoA ligase family protein/GNAT family N-acetyltransferase n=1 Tax=Pusillimonas sp. TaxID=3040095 RepID=UPI0037CB4112
MLRHHLAALFEPRSLLVVTHRRFSVVSNLPSTLQDSTTVVETVDDAGFTIPETLAGVEPGRRVDLALLCVHPRQLPQLLDAVGAHKPRALILLSTDSAPDNALEDMVYCRSWARLNDCTLLGPRSFGVQNPPGGLNLSHMPQLAHAGKVALVAQSRSLVAAVLDWAVDARLGFSKVVSLGDEAGVEVSHVLDYLANDRDTESIALYLEDTFSARSLASALRSAASVKPVVVLKASQLNRDSSAGEAVFNALLRRAGAVRVPYFVQLFSAIKILRHTYWPRGRRIAIFSNGDGAAQLAMSVIGPRHPALRAELARSTIKALQEVLEPGAQVLNPITTSLPITPDTVRKVIEILAADSVVDGILVLLAPDPLADLSRVAQQLITGASAVRKPVITCFMGEETVRPLRHLLDEVGMPSFRTPEAAANAFGVLASYHYNQLLSQQTLPPVPLRREPLLDRARTLIRQAQAERRNELAPDECWELFECFQIPLQRSAGGGPDVDTWTAAEPLMSIRAQRDPRLGPYIKFGTGGTGGLSAYDRAVELPPLNSFLARQLIERSMIWNRVLSRQMTPAAFDNLRESLERISVLVSELPEIDSLILDPLVASDSYVTAHAVQVTLSASSVLVLPESSGYRHMAIHPYPRRLVQNKRFDDDREWTMRPIRPEDAEALQEFIRGLSTEARYMRFVSMLRELTPRMLARYSRIDYDRELALVATVQVPNTEHRGLLREQIIGFAHYLRHPDGRGAEFALVVGDDWQRRQLGTVLMLGLIEAAQFQGFSYIDGYVLTTNRGMLRLMESLGFRNDSIPDDPTTRRVWLDLG